MLSPLDREAVRFFSHLRYRVPPQNGILHLNGELLELWLLKVFYGLAVTYYPDSFIPNAYWLESLFSSRKLSNGQGIYIPKTGDNKGIYNAFTAQLMNRYFPGDVRGLYFQCGWFVCYFCADPAWLPQEEFIYRPAWVGIQYPDQRRGVGLGWDGSGIAFKGPAPDIP
jgi:hypothetical protein